MDSEKTLTRIITEMVALWAVWIAVMYAGYILVIKPMMEADRYGLAFSTTICLASIAGIAIDKLDSLITKEK